MPIANNVVPEESQGLNLSVALVVPKGISGQNLLILSIFYEKFKSTLEPGLAPRLGVKVGVGFEVRFRVQPQLPFRLGLESGLGLDSDPEYGSGCGFCCKPMPGCSTKSEAWFTVLMENQNTNQRVQ